MRRIVVVCSRPSLSEQRQRRRPIERGRSAAPISRAAFEARLRRWYEPTNEIRVDDASSVSDTPWVNQFARRNRWNGWSRGCYRAARPDLGSPRRTVTGLESLLVGRAIRDRYEIVGVLGREA
jgi:hypothetical protein